ncbi:MAG: DUF6701 domain-containing protein, partial [Burkholderiales bacterium]
STYAMNSAGTWTPPAGTTEAADVASLPVPDTLGISLEMNYEARAAAGATGPRSAIIINPPTPDTGATHMLALRPPSSIDHYRVQNNATGVNCQAESITITAHDSSHTAVTLTNTTTITVTAAFVSGSGGPGNRGDWTLLTGAGILSNGTADDGVATYTFAASGESSIVLALKDTWAQTVNIAVTDSTITDTSGTANADASYNQNLVFNPSGFRISNGAGAAATIPTQIAGTPSATLYLQAIRTDTNTGACISAFASGTTVSVDAGFTCNNPTSCAGRQVTLTSTAASSNSAATAPNNNGASPLAYTALNFLFSTANAEAPFTLSYPDVGQLTLNFRHTIPLGTGSPSSNTMLGSSNAFVVKPAGFTITSIQRTADSFANPGASNGTGPIFIKAGDDFTATITAVTSSGAATPNFGKETGPEGVKLTPALATGLGLTTNPAIGNDTVAGSAFTNGVATVTNLSWGEVGIINITPSVGDADYLGVGDVGGTTTGNVGRFIPYDFGISLNTPAFAPGCSTGTAFTYIGQSFGYTTVPVVTVTARNKAGSATRNYTGSWWKITNTSLTGRSYTAATGTLDTTGLPLSTTDPAIADLGGVSSGQGTLTFSAGTGLLFTRAAPVTPFNADISLAINVIDSDGVAYASNPARFGTATAGNGIAFTGAGKTMRWGRLKLSNVLGSEFADLLLPAEVQYYNGTSFVTNADDGCTALPKSAVMFTNFQRNLAACETYLASPPASITFSGGKGALLLKKPGSGNNGSVDLKPRLSATDTGIACVNAASSAATNASMSYLQFNWGGGATYDKNPTGRAVFGAPLVPREFIFFRENY